MEGVYTSILLALCIIGIAYSVMMIFRVDQVYKYRSKVLDWAYEDLPKMKTGMPTDDFMELMAELHRRQAIYESVDFDTMVRQFWRPVKSFYPEYEDARQRV